MTDLNSIFETAPLTNASENPPAADNPKKRGRKKAASSPAGGQAGKRRGPRRTPVASPAAGGQAHATPPSSSVLAGTGKKRGRKPRQPGSSATRPPKASKAGIKLDLTTMMGALVGLKAQDADMVGKITTALGRLNKKSRQRVLEAVGRIFT